MKPDNRTEEWPIGKLCGWDQNPRESTPAGIERLKHQIQKHGAYKPIIVNTNPRVAKVGAVAGGNMRLRAMQELGVKTVWVIPKRFRDKKEMIEISLSDNDRVGRYLEDGLVSLISGLQIDLSDYSVDLNEPPNLDVIVKNYGAAEKGDDSAPALPKKPRSRLGDLYVLGEHRVLCGDSTSENDFKKLMDGELAQVCNTDPPYNVDYNFWARDLRGTRKKNDPDGRMCNDDMSDEQYQEFLINVARNIFKFSADQMSIYWWFAPRNIEPNLKALRDAGFYPSQWIIWLKNSLMLSRHDYHHCFEPCLMGWKKGRVHFGNKNILNLKDVFSGFKNDDEALKRWLSQVFVEEFDVWFQHRDNTKEYLHPTQKPVALAERALKKNSGPGDIVLDCFGGSGSTLIAAHKLGRRARILELDPLYVDVIVTRYCDFAETDQISKNGKNQKW
jgi:DNA modification methylase